MVLNPTNLAIVDDHSLFRETLRNYLSEQKNLNVAILASSIYDLIEKLHQSPADLLLMDLFLPGLHGGEAVRLLRETHPSVKLLVLSMSRDPDLISEMFDLGIHGYISKFDEPEDLLQAIDAIASNRVFRNHHLTEALYRSRQNIIQPSEERGRILFSEREKKILQLIWEEKSSKEMADELFLGVRSVEKIRQDMKEKVGAKSTVGLLKYAISKRIIGVSQLYAGEMQYNTTKRV